MGCGWCCLRDPCMYSHRLYGYTRRCPDLFWDQAASRYVCLLMRDPEAGPEIRKQQGAGEGCCAPLNDWRLRVMYRG